MPEYSYACLTRSIVIAAEAGELAARLLNSSVIFVASSVRLTRHSSRMGVSKYSESLGKVGITGDRSDGHKSRWARETRTIGSGGPDSAAGREEGACRTLVDPDHHHRSPTRLPSRPLSSGGVAERFFVLFWTQKRPPLPKIHMSFLWFS